MYYFSSMAKFNWLKIFVAAAALILFLGAIYYYSHNYLSENRGFPEISSQLQKSGKLVFEMANILQAKLPQSFSGLVEKENAGDFRGSAEIIDGSLKIVEELSQKNELLKQQTGIFNSAAGKLNLKEAKRRAQDTADILGRLVLHFEKIIELERQLLNTAGNYYEALILDPKTEAPSFIQINAKIAVASSEFSSSLGDFAVAANEMNIIVNGQPAINKAPELKIEDIALGQGVEAKSGDTLVVHYEGALQNGDKFDSSVDRGQAFTFVLGSGQVIKGWEEGLLGMKIGGHRRLTIPPELGYGVRGQGLIPSNATLIFEIDLLDIK